MVKRLKRFLLYLSGFSWSFSDNLEMAEKSVLIKLSFFISVLLLFGYGIYTLLSGKTVLGMADISVGLFYCILIAMFLIKGNYRLYTRLGIYTMEALLLFLIVTGGFGNTGYLWTYTFPLYVIFLLGPFEGTAAVILFLVFVGIFFITGFPTYYKGYEFNVKIRFISSFSSVYILVIFFERLRISAFRKVLEKNEQLRYSESRLKDIAFSSSDIIWETDKKNRYIYAGGRTLDILGYENSEFLGKTPFDFCPGEENKKLKDSFNESAWKSCKVIEMTRFGRHKDGRRVDLLTSIMRITDDSGSLKGYRGVDKDITEWKKSEEALKKSENNLRQIIDSAPFGAFVIELSRDSKLIIQSCNQAARSLLNIDFNYEKRELGEIFPKIKGEDITIRVHDLIIKRKNLIIDRFNYDKGMENLIFEFRGIRLGKNRAVLFFYDITERTLREETIKYQAEHDILTGLSNRIVFMKHMQNSFNAAGSKSYLLAVLFLDLDEFKQVNDTYGHAAGDELLRETARRLKASLRDSDIICRLGGDEFAILLPFNKKQEIDQAYCSKNPH